MSDIPSIRNAEETITIYQIDSPISSSQEETPPIYALERNKNDYLIKRIGATVLQGLGVSLLLAGSVTSILGGSIYFAEEKVNSDTTFGLRLVEGGLMISIISMPTICLGSCMRKVAKN